ncbi:type I secretion system permease/ATPase [Rhodovibrio salinarum]|uniref:Type I secretion system permease/ATPase n=1 Tax=Rhodovibrio salinarum TaxID=1087 RepID=A0A934QI65_9PROT|nr:type I secretion system permease/ATPase [Rhodovibrio salinarum]MBK1697446.1 type I secretion system permease/ATPase [Rhodovibrio salinarum]
MSQLAAGPRKRSEQLTAAFASVRGTFVATGVFSFFINLLMFVGPLYMLQVYDRVLTSRNEMTLIMLTMIALGMLAVFGALELMRSRILVRIGGKLDRTLKDKVFDSVFANTRSGEGGSAQALRDLDSLREFLTGAGLIAFFDAPWVPLFLAVVFLFHPLLGLVALTGALVILGLALANELVTRKPLSESYKAGHAANGFVQTSLRNAEAVHAMGMQPGILSRWSHQHAHAIGEQARASDRGGLIISSSKTVRMVLQVAMLAVGASLAIAGTITPGTMIAASIIMGRALAPVEQAVGQWRGFVNARTAYRRLNDALLARDEVRKPMPLPAPQGEVTVEKLAVVPPGSRTPALKGVNFHLRRGEAMGMIGASGAGKSSLARALMGVWPAADGAVRLDAANINDWDPERLGDYIGYLPQDVELFDASVAENIARLGEVDPEAVVRAAKLAGVHEMILHLPDGYDTQIGAGGHALSGGQRQRVALARAVYGDARVILLDEPNAYLDAEGEAALAEAIAQLKAQGRTVVVITHRLQILASVDSVLALSQGQVKTFGPRDEVLAAYKRPAVVAGQHKAPAQEPAASPAQPEAAAASGSGADTTVAASTAAKNQSASVQRIKR